MRRTLATVATLAALGVGQVGAFYGCAGLGIFLLALEVRYMPGLFCDVS